MLQAIPLALMMVATCTANDARAEAVWDYPIHADGGMVYDPLHREAQRTGQLDRYQNVAIQRAELSLDGFVLQADVPRAANSYDVVPIRYRLTWGASKAGLAQRFPVAVEATAFEEAARRAGRQLFDLALPGNVDLKVEYLGSVTAHLRPGGRHNLTADFSDTPAHYPPFDCEPLVRSGVVEAGDLVWFKFRYTNTGDTILDPEGFGGCQFTPELCRKKADGNYEIVAIPYNRYYRDPQYLYPGESHEIWFHFATNRGDETPQGFGLVPGEYLIRFQMAARDYREFDSLLNMWSGRTVFRWEMPITIEAQPRATPVQEGQVVPTRDGDSDRITRFIHTFEEFMTAFDCHIQQPAGVDHVEGTLYLQIAPWTEQVVVKLIATGPPAITTAALPIQVDNSGLTIRPNLSPATCMVRNGRRVPIIYSQTMADMRANVQLGPYPERHIRDRMREMMDCGVNVVSTTSMPWLYDDRSKPAANHQGDAWKYFLDLARREGMSVEGWASYPFDRGTIAGIAQWITGREFKIATAPAGYPDGGQYLSHSDPLLPEANAAAVLYQFTRWGDVYCQVERGEVPIGVEDTRGWMRDDVNTRFPMGELTVRAFQRWVQDKYGNVEAVNRAWDSRFGSFEEIDPDKDQVRNRHGHRWEYTNPQNPFHDWNAAVADLDLFRTDLRARNYRDLLTRVREKIPTATMVLRTEGGNAVVAGLDPRSPNPHFRHAYYSQRRCALVAEVLDEAKVFSYHSDYTTMPYTPGELRYLVRAAVSQGIIPAWLPQFDHMRDIALNDRYGNDYQIHYNLPTPKKGSMMHVLTAAFPWFKIMHEEGAIPGILWEDYECDGFATETQKRELKLFTAKLKDAMGTQEGQQAVSRDALSPSQDWRQGTRAMRSYLPGALPAED